VPEPPKRVYARLRRAMGRRRAGSRELRLGKPDAPHSSMHLNLYRVDLRSRDAGCLTS
jgi:hypothetical protein